MFYYFFFVLRFGCDFIDLKIIFEGKSLDWKQFILKLCVGIIVYWVKCIVDVDVDVVIMLFRFEGFGLNGL